MSHNPFAALADSGDEAADDARSHSTRLDDANGSAASTAATAKRAAAGVATAAATGATRTRPRTPSPPPDRAPSGRARKKAQKKAAKRQKLSAGSFGAVEVEDEEDGEGQRNAGGGGGGAMEQSDDGEGEEEGNEDRGGPVSPADLALAPSDLAAALRVLSALDSTPDLLHHPSLKPLRQALRPLVERLAPQWLGPGGGTLAQLRKRAKDLSARDAARLEYEAALDASARNATALRSARLAKLESLNNLVDGDASAEAALVRRLRVPDGVALTDGRSEDVSLRLLAEGSAGARQLRLTSGGSTAELDAASNATRNNNNGANSSAEGGATLINPIQCYICKTPFKQLHFFYDSLCPPCAQLNYSKRDLVVDLSGKICLLTGARVKIGYRILLRLLRCGATVVATTRFPVDLSQRLRREHDFDRWGSNVKLYGLDLRNLATLEKFVAWMYDTLPHLDVQIHNACQTVRRPAAFYSHLLSGERVDWTQLPPEARPMLQSHYEFSAAVAGASGAQQLGPGGAMRALTGSSVTVPAVDEPSEAAPAASSSSSAAAASSSSASHANSGVCIVEEVDEEGAEEIVVSSAQPRVDVDAEPTAAASTHTHAESTTTAATTSASSSVSTAASSAAPAVSSSSASAAPSQPPQGSKKRSRRGAMRAAEQAAAASQAVTTSSSSGPFTTATALSAESTQMGVLDEDTMSEEERARLFPEGERDVNGQQVDLRAKTSWTMKLEEVNIGEAAECMAVNALAPFLLNGKLKALMIKGNEDKKVPRFIVNVSAMEGKFYRFKSANHPHTNAAKAALNMMTRTSAQDYVQSAIHMTAVDTGWINDENPLEKAAAIAARHNFQTPLDEVDAAARVLDPILTPLQQWASGKYKTLKELNAPWGIFLKDYAKSEW